MFLHFSLFVILYPISILEKALACRPLLESMQVLHLSPSSSPSLFYGLPFELREAYVEHSSSLQGNILTTNSSPLKAGGTTAENFLLLCSYGYMHIHVLLLVTEERLEREITSGMWDMDVVELLVQWRIYIQFNLIAFVVDFHMQMIENSPLATQNHLVL